MRFRFRPKVTLIGLLLIAGMLRLSFWQWQRHTAKQAYIQTLTERLNRPIEPLNANLQEILSAPDRMLHRRLAAEGTYDFEHEMILRNRRYRNVPGVFVLTPLRLKETGGYVLVSRGFVPLNKSDPGGRFAFRGAAEASFVGLVKEGSRRRFLAPADPPSGDGHPWVDAWLRVDLENIAKQLPYPIAPVYLEIMASPSSSEAEQQIVASHSDRDDMFFLPARAEQLDGKDRDLPASDADYPIAVYDTVIPPGRHLGYVFEWAAMAFATLLICIVLQFRRPTERQYAEPLGSR